MWFYYALLSAILWGVGQVFVKKGNASFSPFGDNIIATVVQLVIVVPFLLIVGVDFKSIPSVLPYALAVALLYMTYYYVISKGQISLTATVLSGYPLVTLLLSFIFLREALTVFQILAVGMIVAGVVLLAYPPKSTREHHYKLSEWLPWGIGGAVMVGIVQLLTKIGTAHADANTFTFLMGLSYVPALLVCALFDKEARSIKKMNWKVPLASLVGVAMIEVNLIPLNAAFASGPASLVSAISTLNAVIMVVLAVKYLKEKIVPLQYIGIALTVIGAIIIGG